MFRMEVKSIQQMKTSENMTYCLENKTINKD